MKAGVILLNFGEPETADREAIIAFLERIFTTNASLDGDLGVEAVKKRSRELAERRAPSLIEEYEKIGGSPLNRQAARRAEALVEELRRRGHEVRAYLGMQFTDPLIPEAVRQARADGVDTLIGMPVYPLCGRSTTVAALESLAAAVAELDWDVELHEISGWHRHPGYVELRADNIRRFVESNGLDLDDPRTKLVFSAHGTPIKYLNDGNRYDRYVEESCRQVAEALGVDDYVIGYQNHSNRGVPWTQPDIEKVIEEIDADRVVVDPIAFLHEQSETLAELDIDLKADAEEAALGFFRVPIPHDDDRVNVVLADLIEAFLNGGSSGLDLKPCICRRNPRTLCLNASAAR